MTQTSDLTSWTHGSNALSDSGALMTGDELVGSRALVLVPGTVNYFYNVEGKRLAEALRNLGCKASVCTLDSYVEQEYDWCFLLNLYEIDYAFRDRPGFLREMRKLKYHCRFVVPTLLESVHTKWFNDSFQLLYDSELDTILDMGFEDQRNQLAGSARSAYDFLFNGLTESERRAATAVRKDSDRRPIPWTIVGQVTFERLRLAERFVQEYDPGGFVYLVRHVPYAETGPHLNEGELERVLRRTRYKIWCSHHPYHYLESIRFRLALMNGCVPIKVNAHSHRPDSAAPFASLIFDEKDCVERMLSLDFDAARQAFVDEFCSLPSLEASVLELLCTWGNNS